MHPELFHFNLPSFFNLPDGISISSYVFFNMLGLLFAFIYGGWRAHVELKGNFKQILIAFNAIVLFGLAGGKILGYIKLHTSANAMGNPNGMILYGIILFTIPIVYLLSKYYKVSFLKGLDIMAIAFPILFVFSRIGCLMAGCCYGLPTSHFWGITFTDPHCVASPKGTPLHPTQLYSIAVFLLILIVLWLVKRKQQFEGQLYLLFLTFYSVGRGIIEIFRGDARRGIIIEGGLTYSQFISIFVFVFSVAIYGHLRKKSKKSNR